MSLPPITSTTSKGEPLMTESTSPDAPRQLDEYEYYVGHVKLTAQMTAEQAERVGAKPLGQSEAPLIGQVPNKQAEIAASHMKDPDTKGAVNSNEDPDALDKARETRNRRSR